MCFQIRAAKLLTSLGSIRKFHLNAPSNAVSYVRRRNVTLIPGDGVWPELFVSVKSVFKELGIPVDFNEVQISGIQSGDASAIDSVLKSINNTKVGLKGIIRTPVGAQDLNTVNMKLRRSLDLYANVVHIRSIPGIETRHQGLDIVVIREQLEGEYSSLEHESVKGVIEFLKIITRRNSERIAKFAFDYAVRNNRKRVTAVHKANIMKLSDGLFLETCQKMSKLYPHIEFNSMIIDNCCMQLVSRPQQFDVMVMPNLYGTIVENLCTGLVGGAGLVPGVCYSHDLALFEPGTRHSFSMASGRDIANPTAILLSACNLLRHINLDGYANKLEEAIFKVIKSGRILTKDVGGRSTTTDFIGAILDHTRV